MTNFNDKTSRFENEDSSNSKKKKLEKKSQLNEITNETRMIRKPADDIQLGVTEIEIIVVSTNKIELVKSQVEKKFDGYKIVTAQYSESDIKIITGIFPEFVTMFKYLDKIFSDSIRPPGAEGLSLDNFPGIKRIRQIGQNYLIVTRGFQQCFEEKDGKFILNEEKFEKIINVERAALSDGTEVMGCVANVETNIQVNRICREFILNGQTFKMRAARAAAVATNNLLSIESILLSDPDNPEEVRKMRERALVFAKQVALWEEDNLKENYF